MTGSALHTIRVIDLTSGIAGPYCSKLMAGFGADVIKVESPLRGDRSRYTGPFSQQTAHIETSIPFLWLNTGKKSVTLDIREESGILDLRALLQSADVLLLDIAPADASGFGLDFESLQTLFPRLIVVSLSAFGQTGPYRDFEAEEIQLQALSGMMHMTGEADKPPLAAGSKLCQYTCGAHAYYAALLALYGREVDGVGRHVDLSIQECSLENVEIALTNALHQEKSPKRGPHLGVPWGAYRCRDGHGMVICMPARNWMRATEIFSDPTLFDERYQHILGRIADRRSFEEALERQTRTIPKEELFVAGQSRGLAFGFVASIAEGMALPQHKARGFFETINHPQAGSHLYCGAPFRMSATPWQAGRAPLLGEHNEKGGVHDTNERASSPRAEQQQRPTAKSLLAGLRVIDFSHSWAAPHCGRLLADFGAEVIKVEYVKRLCLLRGVKKKDGAYNHHPAWHQVNRNKLSVTLDLAHDHDRQILRELIAVSDVFLENSRTGVLDKFGFGYQQVAAINERLIMISMSAFGRTGPYAAYAGYGAVFEALSGMQSLTAYEPGGWPQRIREMDVTNGTLGAGAVMTALVHRQRTGKGQHIDFSQLEASIHGTCGEHFLAYAALGTEEVPQGNRHQHYAPQGCYPCAGKEAWVTVTVRSDIEWERFCRVLGHDEWIDDPCFATQAARQAHHDELDRFISDWTRSRDPKEVMAVLQEVGVPAAPVLDMGAIITNPHLQARGYFVDGVRGTDKPCMGLPFRITPGGGEVRWVGPNLGEHNEEVMTGILKRSAAEISAPREDEIGTAFD